MTAMRRVLCGLSVLVFVGIVVSGCRFSVGHGYTPRAMVSEGLSLASGAKAAITEFYLAERRFPIDNDEAGLAPPTEINGKYATSVRVAPGGVIRVLIDQPDAHKSIRGKSLYLKATADESQQLSWSCGSESIEPRHLPSACRR